MRIGIVVDDEKRALLDEIVSIHRSSLIVRHIGETELWDHDVCYEIIWVAIARKELVLFDYGTWQVMGQLCNTALETKLADLELPKRVKAALAKAFKEIGPEATVGHICSAYDNDDAYVIPGITDSGHRKIDIATAKLGVGLYHTEKEK